MSASSSPAFGLLVVAGGGGGGGGTAGGSAGSAGAGGALGGGAGTGSTGGSGGTSDNTTGSAGSFGFGGQGGAGGVGGGGGGGGYYGGGGGGGGSNSGGGGGGSSFVAQGSSGVTGPTVTGAPAQVTITYAAPTADESASAIGFGTQAQGTGSTEQVITVSNNGSAPLVVDAVSLGGTNPGDFLIGNRCQQPVPVAGSCQIGVRFSPQAPGLSSATMTLLTNAPTAPPAIALTGTGGPLPTGPRGPIGLTGPPGQIELVVCHQTTKTVTKGTGPNRHKVTVTQQQCTTQLVSGKVKFTATGHIVTASVSRAGVVYADGSAVLTRAGRWRLELRDLRPIRAGRYTLTLRRRAGRRTILTRSAITIS